MLHYMFCSRKKNYIQDFQNQRYINNYTTKAGGLLHGATNDSTGFQHGFA
jgi:hypothetical protein